MMRDTAAQILELFAEAQDRARYSTARHELTLVVLDRPRVERAPWQAPPLPKRCDSSVRVSEAVSASEALREAAERFAATELTKEPNEAMNAKAFAAGVVAPAMPTRENWNAQDTAPGCEPGAVASEEDAWAR